MITFTIKGTLPDLNHILDLAKNHWSNYARAKEDFGNFVGYSAISQSLPEIQEKVIVHITWYCPDRRKDPDNVAAGIKFILDGLVSAGVLTNDGWKQIGGICHSFKVDKDKPRVEVKLEKTS